MQGQQHLLFLVCLRQPRLGSKCDQEVKVSVAIQGYLSSAIKLLQLWRINADCEKQVDIPSTHSTLLLLNGCNLSVLYKQLACWILGISSISRVWSYLFVCFSLSLFFIFEREHLMHCNFSSCLWEPLISKPLTYTIQILLLNVTFSSENFPQQHRYWPIRFWFSCPDVYCPFSVSVSWSFFPLYQHWNFTFSARLFSLTYISIR